MMKSVQPRLTFLVLALTLAFPATAGQRSVLERRVEKMAKQRMGADFRTEIKFEPEANLCGYEGPAYLVEIKVRRHEKKIVVESGEVYFEDSWETVKEYGIAADDADKGSSMELMDSEACAE